ncbi:9373_t:CDS:2 [Diversispora eburnea]|uniref:9373_t:CDS:1 n=1 Tax=Diversispora eburnea TaxID=1213867 RepID=A0A9N8V037_9GLOM|nr:9373_t:CDS:2 [Diversispora eburnea]
MIEKYEILVNHCNEDDAKSKDNEFSDYSDSSSSIQNLPLIENERINLITENWITHRKETVTRINQFIQRDQIILISAPPFTGKTSLCILMKEYYRKKGIPVIQICFLGVEDMSFEEFWVIETGRSWKYWLNPNHGERVIILDETHHIFVGSQYETFWLRIKSLCKQASLGHQKTIKILAFSTGGKLTTSIPSPIEFQRKFGFELIRCLIKWILNGIDNYFSYRGINYKITTDIEMMSYLKSFDFIEHIKAHRGALRYKFNKKEEDVIDKLLLKSSIQINSIDPDDAVSDLLKSGILIYIDNKGPEFVLRKGRVGFMSSVTRLLSFFHRCISIKHPLQDGFTLQDLAREALSRMNSKVLTHNLGRSKDGMRLLERVWQMEFYRAMYSCLPDEIHISPEVGRMFATDGIVDFYISEPQWAIELLIDDNNITLELASPQRGRYSSIPIKSYLILDIRETRTVQKSYPNTWHITPNEDFTTFNVLEGTNPFDISTKRGYPPSLDMPTSTLEHKALEYEILNLKRKRCLSYEDDDDDEDIQEARRQQNRRDIVESLEKLIDFLTKREKYLRENGAIEEANDVQRQLEQL